MISMSMIIMGATGVPIELPFQLYGLDGAVVDEVRLRFDPSEEAARAATKSFCTKRRIQCESLTKIAMGMLRETRQPLRGRHTTGLTGVEAQSFPIPLSDRAAAPPPGKMPDERLLRSSIHRLDPWLRSSLKGDREDGGQGGTPFKECRRGVPRQQSQSDSAGAARGSDDLERLRRRVREFQHTAIETGPSFLNHHYAQMGHCTACRVHVQAREQASEEGWREFGLVRQTFYDDWAVESSCGAVRVAGQGRKHGIVLSRDRGWEGARSAPSKTHTLC